MRNLLLTLIFAAAASPVFAADCESQLIDSRYGVISQSDYRLNKAGLFNFGVSNLCGPMCLINAVTKVRVVMNLPAADPVAEFTRLMNDIVPKAGLDREDIIKSGITSGNLAKLAQYYLNEDLKVPATVSNHWVGEKSVVMSDLLGSHGDRKIVMLAYSDYPIVNPQASPFRYSARDGGHFVVVRGDPAQGGAMAVTDSANGLRTMFVSGEVIFSDKTGNGLWLKLHPDSLPADSMVATDVITIELTPKPVSGD